MDGVSTANNDVLPPSEALLQKGCVILRQQVVSIAPTKRDPPVTPANTVSGCKLGLEDVETDHPVVKNIR